MSRLLCVLLLVLLGTADAHGAACSLRLVADLTLRDTSGFLTVPVRIGDRTVSMIVDTGSEVGLLSHAAADGLALRKMGRITVAMAPTLSLGGFTVDGFALPVGELPMAPRIEPSIEGLLGGDFLSQFDVEIDAARGTLRLFEASGLTSLCRDLPPWAGPFDTIGLERAGDRETLSASLDGRPITALLDSGARSRIVARRAALAIGVDAGVLDGEPGGITSGIGEPDAIYHWHRFKSLTIGASTERRPVLTVTRFSDRSDMLLGADWFERHLVWISYATARLFVQPSGQR